MWKLLVSVVNNPEAKLSNWEVIGLVLFFTVSISIPTLIVNRLIDGFFDRKQNKKKKLDEVFVQNKVDALKLLNVKIAQIKTELLTGSDNRHKYELINECRGILESNSLFFEENEEKTIKRLMDSATAYVSSSDQQNYVNFLTFTKELKKALK